MVEIIEPNAPTLVIKLMRNGSLAVNAPQDKMLALSMLSVATAIIQRDLISGGAIGSAAPLIPPVNGNLQ